LYDNCDGAYSGDCVDDMGSVVMMDWVRAGMMSYILYVGLSGIDRGAYKWVIYAAIWLVIFYIAGRLTDGD